MTITRLFQSGMEEGSILEIPALSAGTGTPSISTVKAHTGIYSIRHTTGILRSLGAVFTPTTQIRSGVWLNHNGLAGASTSYRAVLFRWTTPESNANFLRWAGDTNALELVVAGTVVGSVGIVASGLSAVDIWYHVGINLFANATTGWATVYVNGGQVLSVASTNFGSAISEFYFGGAVGAAGGWASASYFDDFYVDATPGETDVAPPLKSFLWAVANGNGASSQWVGNDANSVDNYLLVDDVPPDSATTYVYTTAVDQKDTYALGNITIPPGYSIVAIIKTAFAMRAGITEEIKLVTFDGTTTILSAAKVPAAAYGPIWDREVVQPDATAWNETDFNAMQFGIQSAGTF